MEKLYQHFERRAHAGYRETKALVGTVARRGWRHILPWIYIALGIVLVYRIGHGLPLPGVAELSAVLTALGANTGIGQFTRSMEARMGVANGQAAQTPGGGLVNNEAIAR